MISSNTFAIIIIALLIIILYVFNQNMEKFESPVFQEQTQPMSIQNQTPNSTSNPTQNPTQNPTPNSTQNPTSTPTINKDANSNTTIEKIEEIESAVRNMALTDENGTNVDVANLFGDSMGETRELIGMDMKDNQFTYINNTFAPVIEKKYYMRPEE